MRGNGDCCCENESVETLNELEDTRTGVVGLDDGDGFTTGKLTDTFDGTDTVDGTGDDATGDDTDTDDGANDDVAGDGTDTDDGIGDDSGSDLSACNCELVCVSISVTVSAIGLQPLSSRLAMPGKKCSAIVGLYESCLISPSSLSETASVLQKNMLQRLT